MMIVLLKVLEWQVNEKEKFQQEKAPMVVSILIHTSPVLPDAKTPDLTSLL